MRHVVLLLALLGLTGCAHALRDDESGEGDDMFPSASVKAAGDEDDEGVAAPIFRHSVHTDDDTAMELPPDFAQHMTHHRSMSTQHPSRTVSHPDIKHEPVATTITPHRPHHHQHDSVVIRHRAPESAPPMSAVQTHDDGDNDKDESDHAVKPEAVKPVESKISTPHHAQTSVSAVNKATVAAVQDSTNVPHTHSRHHVHSVGGGDSSSSDTTHHRHHHHTQTSAPSHVVVHVPSPRGSVRPVAAPVMDEPDHLTAHQTQELEELVARTNSSGGGGGETDEIKQLRAENRETTRQLSALTEQIRSVQEMLSKQSQPVKIQSTPTLPSGLTERLQAMEGTLTTLQKSQQELSSKIKDELDHDDDHTNLMLELSAGKEHEPMVAFPSKAPSLAGHTADDIKAIAHQTRMLRAMADKREKPNPDASIHDSKLAPSQEEPSNDKTEASIEKSDVSNDKSDVGGEKQEAVAQGSGKKAHDEQPTGRHKWTSGVVVKRDKPAHSTAPSSSPPKPAPITSAHTAPKYKDFKDTIEKIQPPKAVAHVEPQEEDKDTQIENNNDNDNKPQLETPSLINTPKGEARWESAANGNARVASKTLSHHAKEVSKPKPVNAHSAHTWTVSTEQQNQHHKYAWAEGRVEHHHKHMWKDGSNIKVLGNQEEKPAETTEQPATTTADNAEAATLPRVIQQDTPVESSTIAAVGPGHHHHHSKAVKSKHHYKHVTPEDQQLLELSEGDGEAEVVELQPTQEQKSVQIVQPPAPQVPAMQPFQQQVSAPPMLILQTPQTPTMYLTSAPFWNPAVANAQPVVVAPPTVVNAGVGNAQPVMVAAQGMPSYAYIQQQQAAQAPEQPAAFMEVSDGDNDNDNTDDNSSGVMHRRSMIAPLATVTSSRTSSHAGPGAHRTAASVVDATGSMHKKSVHHWKAKH